MINRYIKNNINIRDLYINIFNYFKKYLCVILDTMNNSSTELDNHENIVSVNENGNENNTGMLDHELKTKINDKKTTKTENKKKRKTKAEREAELCTGKCGICGVDFTKEVPAIRLRCGHLFHYECVKTWYLMIKGKKKSGYGYVSYNLRQCPYCRKCGGLLKCPPGHEHIPGVHRKSRVKK